MRKLSWIDAWALSQRISTVEYFMPDTSKDGGEYLFKSGVVEKISPAERVVVVGGEVIRMDRIVGISSDLFAGEF